MLHPRLHYGRKTTGRCFVKLIGDKTKETFEEVIRKHVHIGSLVWTDGHKSYDWLDDTPDFTHEGIVHRKGEFVRLRKSGVRVSTNAIEGLFSRMKRFLRGYQAAPKKREHYAAFMGEFLWRTEAGSQKARGKETTGRKTPQTSNLVFFVEVESKSQFPSVTKGGVEGPTRLRSRFLRREAWRRHALWELLKVLRRGCKANAPPSPWVGDTEVFDVYKKSVCLPKKKKKKKKKTRRGRFGRRPANPNLAVVPAPPPPEPSPLEAAMAELLSELENEGGNEHGHAPLQPLPLQDIDGADPVRPVATKRRRGGRDQHEVHIVRKRPAAAERPCKRLRAGSDGGGGEVGGGVNAGGGDGSGSGCPEASLPADSGGASGL